MKLVDFLNYINSFERVRLVCVDYNNTDGEIVAIVNGDCSTVFEFLLENARDITKIEVERVYSGLHYEDDIGDDSFAIPLLNIEVTGYEEDTDGSHREH